MHLSANLRTICSVTDSTTELGFLSIHFCASPFFCILRSHSWINNNKCDGWWLALWFDYVYWNAGKCLFGRLSKYRRCHNKKSASFSKRKLIPSVCAVPLHSHCTNERADRRAKKNVKNTSFIHLHEREKFNWICRVLVLIILLCACSHLLKLNTSNVSKCCVRSINGWGWPIEKRIISFDSLIWQSINVRTSYY